jgi:hypothetical protein
VACWWRPFSSSSDHRVKSWPPLFQDQRKLSRCLKCYRQLVVGAIRGLSLWKSMEHLFGFKMQFIKYMQLTSGLNLHQEGIGQRDLI